MKAIAIIVIFCSTTLLFAQSALHTDSTLTTIGPYDFSFGVGAGASTVGITTHIDVSHGSRNTHFTYRLLFSQELTLFGPSPPNRAWEIGILYGIYTRASYGMASISAGLAVSGGVERGVFVHQEPGWFGRTIHESQSYTGIGIPLVAKVVWNPLWIFGIGLNGFANINSRRSYHGVSLEIRFLN